MNKETKNETNLNTSLADNELLEISGGTNGPEELDWREISDVKRPGNKPASLWSFSAEGNVEGQYFKKINKDK